MGKRKKGDKGKEDRQRISRRRERKEEDLACFSFGRVSGLLTFRRLHRGAPVSAAAS